MIVLKYNGRGEKSTAKGVQRRGIAAELRSLEESAAAQKTRTVEHSTKCSTVARKNQWFCLLPDNQAVRTAAANKQITCQDLDNGGKRRFNAAGCGGYQ